MLMSFTFVHAVSADEFLARSLFCKHYMRSTYVDGLGFESCEVEYERYDANDQLIVRVLAVRPRMAEWGRFGRVLSEVTAYREVSTLRDGVWTSDLVPKHLTNRVHVKTTAHVEPINPSTCRCVFNVELKARVPVIGWLIERRLARLIRINLAQSHVHSTQWLAGNAENWAGSPVLNRPQ